MKKISFKMSDNFKIAPLCRNNVYALENNSALLEIDCNVQADLTYKLHIAHGGNKSYVLMDKNEDSVSVLLTAPYINSNGIYYVQLEGIKEDYRIISNSMRLEVGSFINAEHIPTPEEESVIDRLAIKVTNLEEEKQDKLTAGDNITINGVEISANVPTKTSDLLNDSDFTTNTLVNSELSKKQDVLTAGNNININNNVVSANVPTKTSELLNDSNYATLDEVEAEVEGVRPITGTSLPTASLDNLHRFAVINEGGTERLFINLLKNGSCGWWEFVQGQPAVDTAVLGQAIIGTLILGKN